MFPISSAASSNVTAQAPRPELPGGWHFVRTPNPRGGPEAVSIMHTADTSRSDLDLAGLEIRCGERGPEALITLITAFPLRARPHVVFGKPENEAHFEATVAPPGASILVPGNATNLISGPWHAQSDLFVRVEYGDTIIRGVVTLVGLQTAFNVLVANCPNQ